MLQLRHPLFDFAAHLLDVDVQSIAIDRSVGLEVEDHTNSVAAHCLLVERVFTNVNRILQRLIPVIRKFEILMSREKLHEEIFRAIQIHDKLLMVLFENSMRSEWVISEIRRARRVEREENRRKLFLANMLYGT